MKLGFSEIHFPLVQRSLLINSFFFSKQWENNQPDKSHRSSPHPANGDTTSLSPRNVSFSSPLQVAKQLGLHWQGSSSNLQLTSGLWGEEAGWMTGQFAERGWHSVQAVDGATCSPIWTHQIVHILWENSKVWMGQNSRKRGSRLLLGHICHGRVWTARWAERGRWGFETVTRRLQKDSYISAKLTREPAKGSRMVIGTRVLKEEHSEAGGWCLLSPCQQPGTLPHLNPYI